MRKRSIQLVLAVSAIIAVLSGCASGPGGNGGAEDQGVTVYTSFYTMYDFAGKIGGDKINLTNLVPAGTEPHDWEPAPMDIANLEKADILIYNGAGMEDWIEKVLSSIDNDSLLAVEASKSVKLLEDPDEDHGDLEYDPHVWLNPMNAKMQLESIKDALVEADPSNRDYYESNYSDYAQKLDGLDAEFREAVSGFQKRDIIVAHQAFGYLCEAYGLTQVAIEGLSADAEPSPARMAEITEFARKNDVKYIFFEELISPKVAEAIAREIGAETAVLNPLEGLEEEDIKAGKEYFTVMRENLEALKKALQ